MRHATRRNRRGGFTLVELLVVITIIALISAAALPSILPALNERRVSESARILQAILAGTRDAAIRANAPRGIRLLPDPVLNGLNGQGLASNRIIPIEAGPDYTEGLITAISPINFPSAASTPNYYQTLLNGNTTTNNGTAQAGSPGTYLLLAESDFSSGIPNNPTSWSLNLRQGDKIRFNDSGAYYTIAGPISGYPFNQNPASGINQNYEHVIASFSTANAIPPLASQAGWAPEVLIVLNGKDDNGNGWIDESCDGIDNDGDGIVDPGFNGIDDAGYINGVAYGKNGIIDEPAEMMISGNPTVGFSNAAEFEQEVYLGSSSSKPPFNQAYTVFRRPVVSPGARETTLPAGVVIDLTSWNASTLGYGVLPERSRLPVDASTYFVDIMLDQTGRVVTQGAGSDGGGAYRNSPLSSLPFYHFWLTEREGVVSIPSNATTNPLLPMPKNTPFYAGTTYLTGERRLVTLFVKTGQIVSNSIPDQYFNGNDVNYPFYNAQSGVKESL